MKIIVDRSLLPFEKNQAEPQFYVAVSGGVDSVAAAAFLFKFYGRSMGICHFHHRLRPQNHAMENAAIRLADHLGVKIQIGERTAPIKKEYSVEHELRQARLEFFNSLNSSIVLAHHLDDAVEGYFMNMLRGNPEHVPIPTRTELGNSVLLRPFMNTNKSGFEDLACKWDLRSYIVEDETNSDESFRRNWVRNTMLPQLKQFGLRKVVRKKFYS